MTCGSNAAHTALSAQPIYGGPAYLFRNVVVNEPGVGEGQAAEQARDRHVFARGDVAAVVVCPAQRTRGAAKAFEAKRVSHWIRARANVGFDQLRERVEPGVRGVFRR